MKVAPRKKKPTHTDDLIRKRQRLKIEVAFWHSIRVEFLKEEARILICVELAGERPWMAGDKR